jgi:hypothetical protein
MSLNARSIALLAALALGVLALASLAGCTPRNMAEPTPVPADQGAAPATPEVSPTPAPTPEPTPDARKEEGGVIDKSMPAANPLPKVPKKAVQIESKDLKE